MPDPKTALLHFTAPPIVGGVEAVMLAHAQAFASAGEPLRIIAGRGEPGAFPDGTEFVLVPELDSLHPEIAQVSKAMEAGEVPNEFDRLVSLLVDKLEIALQGIRCLIVHNAFTKHFNLPLTAALFRLLDARRIPCCIAWCHDFSWSSPSSRLKVHPGYPWDLLRTFRLDIEYVTISEARRTELAELMGCLPGGIRVVYNGVNPAEVLGLSAEGEALAERLDLFSAGLVVLMPVRITRAKNIELALNVAANLKSRNADLRVILTGPPDPHDEQIHAYYQGLLDLRRRYGLEQEFRFVYECGPSPGEPYIIGPGLVGELYRLSDLLFLPSWREGFGMPVLEAGLAGLAVFTSPIPAASEIGAGEVSIIQPEDDPGEIADRIFQWGKSNPQHLLRQRVRQNFTWRAIFEHSLRPLLNEVGNP